MNIMLDDYVTFGRSGLRVSRFGLGAFNFGGSEPWSLDAEAAHALIARYCDLGGNFLDAANTYGGGAAEDILGSYFAANAGMRDRLVLASKFGSNIRAGDPNAGGGSRKSIAQTCEQSLRRLRTDRIDIYWMHIWDPLTPIDETLRALDDLVAAGKILYVGISNTPAWKIAEACCLGSFFHRLPIAGLQLQYSLLERNIEVEHVPMAQAFGLGLAAWSPLKSGLLSGRFRKSDPANHDADGRASFITRLLDDKAETILDVVQQVATRVGASAAQVSLAWLLSRPHLHTAILGAHAIAQLDENIAAVQVRLSPEDLAALDQASAPPIPYPGDFARRALGAVSGGSRINGILPSSRGSPSQSGR